MENMPQLDRELVGEFVGKAHGDITRVREILGENPTIVNSAWDWGAGDWETALGAAAHMGRRDIAELLLANGARIDLFAAAMLNKIEVVRAILTDNPMAKASLGPHGIPLIAHAKAGEADLVLAYLQTLA